jgi:hypothetical protein
MKTILVLLGVSMISLSACNQTADRCGKAADVLIAARGQEVASRRAMVVQRCSEQGFSEEQLACIRRVKTYDDLGRLTCLSPMPAWVDVLTR